MGNIQCLAEIQQMVVAVNSCCVRDLNMVCSKRSLHEVHQARGGNVRVLYCTIPPLIFLKEALGWEGLEEGAVVQGFLDNL